MSDNLNSSKEILHEKGEIIGVTNGNSMWPLFRSGKDKAVIIPQNTNFKVGDVLLYCNPHTKGFILHRIIKITESGLIIRGDNVYFTETNVKSEDIIGILKGFYRNGKYFDCKKNLLYKFYSFFIRSVFPIRYFIHRIITKIKKLLGS